MDKAMLATLFPRVTRALCALGLAVLMALPAGGCFNTYKIEEDEFAKLQRPDEVPRVVTSTKGTEVLVDRGTSLFVRSDGGRRYPVTAYNFKLTDSQLVASDRDTLLMKGELKSYEIDLLSKPKTALLISAGVAAVAGIIVATVLTAGRKSFNEQ